MPIRPPLAAPEYVPIPNLKQQHLALTTLRLDESDARADEQFRDPASVLRQFRHGTRLSLIFLIETDQPDKLPENFDASIELFSGDQSVLKSPVTPVPHQSLLFARAELTLAGQLKTGQYYLVAYVTQHSGKRVLKATGWTDFQVVPYQTGPQGEPLTGLCQFLGRKAPAVLSDALDSIYGQARNYCKAVILGS
jgi:hypothetical protein